MLNKSQLPRVLGLWMAVALVVGTVIGSGIFKKPGSIAKDYLNDFGLILGAWIVVGIFSLLGALALAEVAVLLPRAGGNYIFLKEAYGEGAGFLWGWVDFGIIRSASIAALATVFAGALHEVLRQIHNMPPGERYLSYWQQQGIAIATIILLNIVNAHGTVLGGSVQVVVTAVKVVTLLAIALMPLALWLLWTDRGELARVENLQPIWPADWSQVNWSKFGGAMVGIMFAYHGWMNLAPMAGEIERPNRNLPLAFLLGTLAVIVLYVSANAAYHLVVPREAGRGLIMEKGTVAEQFFFVIVGPIGLMLASIGIMISTFGALNGNLLVGPRLLYAMGKDGLAPRVMANLHPRHQTPYIAHWTLTAWSVFLIVAVGVLSPMGVFPAGKDPFDVLTEYCIFGALTFETLAVASIFPLRRRNPPGRVDLPYRCPLYPWIPLVYVAAMGVVLVNMFWTSPNESLYATGFIVIGAVVYVLISAWRNPSKGPIDEPTPTQDAPSEALRAES